ncbi:MAG TPA: hypothetical protein VKF38_05875 [Anaerolineaceae bacterium]|nr:hypothetical protein [Anaerolineaceae bacterium]
MKSLVRQTLAGSFPAAKALGKAMSSNPDHVLRQDAGLAISKLAPQASLNGAWDAWCETRQPELGQILLKLGQPASSPLRTRVMSLLWLDKLSFLENSDKEMIEPLIQACQDSERKLAERALQAIAKLKNQNAINYLCSLWAQTRLTFLDKIIVQAGYLARDPSLVRMLTALKLNRIEIVLQGKGEVVEPLLICCNDADIEIASRAKYCLYNLQNEEMIQMICQKWLDTRQPLLEQAIVQAHYLPPKPLKVHILCALKLARVDIACKTIADGVNELLEDCQDSDQVVRDNARQALLNLESIEARERLCQLAIEQDNPIAKEIALAAGYLPQETGQKALFLFLMQQWPKYDALDFDQRLMRVIYETADSELRQRIVREIQATGNTSYLGILAGMDEHANVGSYSSDEIQTLLNLLAGAHEWQKLWDLVFELALPWSVKIVQTIANTNWIPFNSEDQSILLELINLATSHLALDGNDLIKMAPIAIERAHLKAPGRINSVAFSPSQPVLAIGTGSRHAILWNYKQGQVEQVFNSFKHSIGKVAYTKSGTLLCAERSLRQESCTVYTTQSSKISSLGTHTGAITGLETFDENFVLTTGRDNRAVVWDIAKHSLVAEKKFDFWPRSICSSPDAKKAALFHHQPSLVSLPDLKTVFIPSSRADNSQIHISMAHCAVFSLDSKDVIVGQLNGQAVIYHDIFGEKQIRKSLLTQQSGPVEGLIFLPNRNLILSAGASGLIQFHHWPDCKLTGSITYSGKRLTSLQTSPDGAFMATGSNEAELILWDLRILEVPSLLSQPIAQLKPDHLAVINSLIESKQINPELERTLEFLRILIQHRYRYDIEVDEIPTIQMGEFDILIDDETIDQ